VDTLELLKTICHEMAEIEYLSEHGPTKGFPALDEAHEKGLQAEILVNEETLERAGIRSKRWQKILGKLAKL